MLCKDSISSTYSAALEIAQPRTLVSPGVGFIITLVLSTLSLYSTTPVAVYQPSANLYSQLSLVGSNQKYQDIYGISRSCWTSLSTYKT